jgi:two-component system, NarL family, sensor histidine kinase DesK
MARRPHGSGRDGLAALFGGGQGSSLGGWRTLLFPGIWLVYLVQTAGGVADHSDGAVSAVGYAIVAVFGVSYILAIRAAGRDWGVEWYRRRYWRWFALMVVLTLAEIPIAHEDAFVMFVFITVLVMAGLAFAGHARTVIAAIVGMTAFAGFLPAAIPSWDAGIDWNMMLTLPLVALAMFGFFTILRSNRELSQARAEVARLAAENERSRIARDLHDLLGHSLTTVTVKAGLANRLAGRDPGRAAREIGEVERLTRSALADVRAAVEGYREITLAGELASAHEVLRAAGIDAQAPRGVDVVDPAHVELFGWVVREGVTNVVRHSRARTCTIALGPDWLEIADDGRGDRVPAPAGSGLAGLRERVAAAGGTVLVGAGPRGWRLRVDMDGAVTA